MLKKLVMFTTQSGGFAMSYSLLSSNGKGCNNTIFKEEE